MPFSKVIFGRTFLCGMGCQDEQLRDFYSNAFDTEERVDAHGTYRCLAYGADTLLPWRFQSLNLTRYGALEVVGQHNGYMTTTASLRELTSWVHAHAAVANINNYFENTLGGELDNDVAVRIGFDIDLKQGGNYQHLPEVDREQYILDPQVFLPWVIGKVQQFMQSTFGVHVPTTEMYVSCSNRTHTPDQVQFILDPSRHDGVQSYHVVCAKLVLRTMAERACFGAHLARFTQSQDGCPLGSIIDLQVYGKNRNMRALGAQKADKVPLMPLASMGTLHFADREEYARWQDIPLETVMDHLWCMVPADASGLDPARLESAAPSVPRGPRALPGPHRWRDTSTTGTETDTPPDLHTRIIAHFAEYCRARGVPFTPDDYRSITTTTARAPLDGRVAETHFALKPGCTRTCFMHDVGGTPIVHGSNNFILTLSDDNALEYMCFGAARPCAQVVEGHDSDGDEPEPEPASSRRLRSCRRFGAHCCALPLGRLSYAPFEMPCEVELPTDPETGKVTFSPPQVLTSKGRPAECPLVIRAPYGSGKTYTVITEIVHTLEKKPSARVGYVSNLRTTVQSITATINDALVQAHLAGHFMQYYLPKDQSKDAREGGNIAFVVMSARDIHTSTKPFDLLIIDESEACLRQIATLRSSNSNVLENFMRIVTSSTRIRCLDADADTLTAMLLQRCTRGMLIADAPRCKPFASTAAVIHASFGPNYAFHAPSQYAEFLRLAEGTRHGMAIQCATVKDAYFIKRLLLTHLHVAPERVHVVCKAATDAEKAEFLRVFTGAAPPAGPPRFFIYSPAIGPAVSNTFCDIVCSFIRSNTQSTEDMAQGLLRCRKAEQLHLFPMQLGLLMYGTIAPVSVTRVQVPLAESLDETTSPAGGAGVPVISAHQLLPIDNKATAHNFMVYAQLCDHVGKARPHMHVNMADYVYTNCTRGGARDSTSLCKTSKSMWRFETAPARSLYSLEDAANDVNLNKACQEALRAHAAGGSQHTTFRTFLLHMASSAPRDWQAVARESGEPESVYTYIHMHRWRERMNRPHVLMPRLGLAMERCGIVTTLHIHDVTDEDVKRNTEVDTHTRLGSLMDAVNGYLDVYNSFIRPRVHVLDNASACPDRNAFLQVLKNSILSRDKAEERNARKAAVVNPEFAFLNTSELTFAKALVHILSSSDTTGDAVDEDNAPDIDGFEDEVEGDGFVTHIVRSMAYPIVYFGRTVVNAMVDSVHEKAAQFAKTLKVNTPEYRDFIGALNDFSLLFDADYRDQHELKLEFHVAKGIPAPGRLRLLAAFNDTTSTRLNQIECLNAFLTAVTTTGCGVINIHGATVRHIFETDQAICNRMANPDRVEDEKRRRHAYQTFRKEFPFTGHLPKSPVQAARVLVQQLRGRYYIVTNGGDKNRPDWRFKTDTLTRECDAWITNAADGDIRRLIDTRQDFFTMDPIPEGERPRKKQKAG